MKQTLSLLMVFIVVNSVAQTDTLKLSFYVWPPFTNVQGEISIATDIVETALNRVNIPSTYLLGGFESALEGIFDGSCDGSPAFWKSEEREQELLFSDPYLENQLILVGRKGANVAFTSFSELEQKRIGLVRDYAYGDSLTEIVDLQIVYGTKDQENLVNLLSDKVDYILVDALLLQYLLKYELNDVSSMLEFAKQALIVNPLHLAIRKDLPDATHAIDQFNAEIKKMINEGLYNELLGLDCLRADIDGDGTLEIVLNCDAAGTEPPEYTYDVFSSDAANTNQFYIAGNYYNSWEEVPDKYKVTIPPPEGADSYNYGMTIKF